MPDETPILWFRHRLEKHKLADQILATVNNLLIERGFLLKTGTVVEATLIAVPSSNKNNDKARDLEMHSSQKGNQWHFGMKAHIGADAYACLVLTVRGTSGNVHDVLEGNSLLHWQEVDAYGDAGYKGIHKRPDANSRVTWHVAIRQGKRKAFDKSDLLDQLTDQFEKFKPASELKWSICFGLSSASLAMSKRVTVGSRRTRNRWLPCLPCPICGWCGQSYKGRRDECLCCRRKWS